MLQQADPYRATIRKHRKSFIWKGPFIQVLEDITGNTHYYNYNIALKR